MTKDYKIITDIMHYNSNCEVTYFFGPSFIISDTKTIYCENGWYNTKTDIAQFRKNSYITTDNYLLKGDSLYYNKNKQYGKAYSNVELIDTVEKQASIVGIKVPEVAIFPSNQMNAFATGASKNNALVAELSLNILKKAATYEKQDIEKKKSKPYKFSKPKRKDKKKKKK